jgi:cytochrome c
MRYLKKLIFMLLVQALFVGATFAGTPEQAKALAEKAAAYAKEVGPEKAFEAFSSKDPKWHEHDLYVFALSFDGMMLANGANKAMVGKNMMEMHDVNGVYMTKDAITAVKAKGNGWVDYMFSNPETKMMQAKSSYHVRIPNYDGLVGVGIYK